MSLDPMYSRPLARRYLGLTAAWTAHPPSRHTGSDASERTTDRFLRGMSVSCLS